MDQGSGGCLAWLGGGFNRAQTKVSVGAVLLVALHAVLFVSQAFALPERAEKSDGPEPKDRTLGAASSRAEDTRIPGSYIVVFNDTVDRPGVIAEQQAEQRDGDLGFIYPGIKGYSVSDLSRGDVEALRNDPKIDYVVPDRRVKALAQTTPKGISRIFANENPFLDIDSVDDFRVNADVAVIDTGVDQTHPDLDVVERTDCSAGSPCVNGSGGYGEGHGTHVAGTIGAIDNGSGVVGVAPGVRIWSVKVLDEEGYGSTSEDIAGIEWVTAHASQIEVANMSIGFEGRAVPEEEAIEKSIEAGVVYVAAASNDAYNAEGVHPANDPDVITVSNLVDYDGKAGGLSEYTCTYRGPDDTLSSTSNWGSRVDIAAPGVCIYSTWPGGSYEFLNGTSMASPHVAGAAAVLASKSNPNSKAAVETIRQTLINEGSFNWTDTSEDAAAEPLLYLGGTPLTKTEVATAGASSTDEESASLSGAINPRGLETTYKFEYGTTTGYGQSAPAVPKTLSAGAGYTTVSQAIGGLKPEQTYHYRLAAMNSSGTTYGEDRTVTPSVWSLRTPVSKPERTGHEYLNDVSCSSPTSCMAIGHNYNDENRVVSYEQTGDDWGWHAVPTPVGGEVPELEGVSCTAPNACTAVGWVEISEANKAMAVRWNGSSWSNQSMPVPSGALYSYLEDVSCASSTECMAVGYYMNASEEWVNYSSRWKSGSWTTLTTPNAVDSAESELDGVSCVSSTSCKAVGWYESTGGTTKRVILSWNGSSWSLQSAAEASGKLEAISCVSAEFCIAASSLPTIEKWNGSSWTTQTAPLPPGMNEGFVEGISCTRTTYCMIAGYARTGPRIYQLLEAWNGTAWVAQSPPREAESKHRLFGISCAGIADCAVVGETKFDYATALIENRKGAVTGNATSISPAQVTLTGSVNPGGAPTTYRFEYGKTTSYGTSAPAPDGSAGSGAETVELSATATELAPHTVYHFRLVASNANGTSYGADRTFTTTTAQHQFQSSFSGSGEAKVDGPWGVDVDANGNIWVADLYHHRIEKFNSKGELLLKFGSFGSGNGQFKEPVDIAVVANGDLWVTDAGNDRVQKFNSKGEYLGQFGSSGSGSGKFVEPWGIDVGPNGHIWVSDNGYYRVEEFDPSGSFVREVHGAGQGGSGNAEFAGPTGVAIDASGNVWVADSGNNRVQKLSPTGEFLDKFGAQGTGNGEFESPQAIDITETGELLVVDRWTGRVQQFTSQGEYLTQFGPGELVEPHGLATASYGTVYVSNTWGDRVEAWQELVPLTSTQPASGVIAAEATLNGIVNPRGLATTYRFEYGKTTAYGSSAPVPSASVGSGTSDVAISKLVEGLAANTQYHFRLVASNSNGTTYGKDEVFTTAEGTGSKLAGMAVTEPFNGSSGSLAEFSANWSALGWAGGSNPKGEDTASGWRPVDLYSTVNGTYYKSTVTDTGPGIAAVATMAANPGNANRYFSVWLDASGSASTRSGYELRFTYVSTNTYNVALSKWQGGTQTVLASKSSYSFANGSSFAIADEGATVSAWTDTGSGFGQLLSAGDSSFGGGNAGVEGSGFNTRLTNFKAGSLLAPVANMNAALNGLALTDSFGTNESPLSGGGAWAALAWDNGASGNNTGRVLGGWGPYDAYSAINGAYWTKAGVPDTGAGVGVAATLTTVPSTNRYFSLGLDMPSPSAAHTGYELRFTQTASGVYEVLLCKWQSGSKTTLASKTGYSFSTGSKFALVDKGGTVSVWTKTGSEYTQLLSASDTAFNAGYVGVEGSGNLTRLTDFRSGPLAPF